MSDKKNRRVWVYAPEAPKFTTAQKEKLISEVKKTINEKTRISKRVKRIEMKANRIYMYALFEQHMPLPEGAILIKPLIEGKYIEYPYCRITLKDGVNSRNSEKDSLQIKCSLDWQRHNNQWMTLYEGTLCDCIEYMETETGWFD